MAYKEEEAGCAAKTALLARPGMLNGRRSENSKGINGEKQKLTMKYQYNTGMAKMWHMASI
jgi:hypothetical protein